jgi:hypothetical protein
MLAALLAPDAGAFNPATDIPGGNCVLWLKADAGVVGNPVTEWQDQSGNANHATTVSDGVGNSDNPTYVASVPAINNKPALSFNNGHRLGYPSLSARTVFFVCKVGSEGTQDHGLLAVKDSTAIRRNNNVTAWQHPGNGEDFSNPGGSSFRVNGDTTPNVLEDVWHIGDVLRSGSSASFNRVGGYYDGRNLKGDVAEVIIYDRELDDDERTQVGAYLAQKYRITTDYTPPPGGTVLIVR